MGKRITNTVLAIATFAVCAFGLEWGLFPSIVAAQLCYIGTMLYDVHGYLEIISKK